MSTSHIRCCIIGGQERDLYVLGEVHKRPDVDIAFVYDKDANALALEIAEILGIDRISSLDGLAATGPLDYIIVAEPDGPLAEAVAALKGTDARVLDHPGALDVICSRVAPRPAVSPAEEPTYSIDDALEAFERLFDREKLLEFLLGVAVQAAGAEAGSIMMYSEDADELYIVYATGLSERVIRNTRQRLGEGIAGVVAKERKGKVIRQAPGQTLWAADRDRADLHSAISVPLIFDERLLGVLNVSSSEAGSELTRVGLNTLERLSLRISHVLNESLKLQETRVRHQEMSLRKSVGELTEKSISPNAKFSVISNYLSDLVVADTVEIFVSTHEGDWLVLGGSNRRLSAHPELVRCDRGALSRAYLDRRQVILTESADPDDRTAPVTSFIFTPLVLGSTLGVLMLEFSERYRLDEFLAIKDSVVLELSRFIASEKRERLLKRELSGLSVISDGAPLLLICRTLDDLCDFLARLVADALDCERVSVRVLDREKEGRVSRFESSGQRAVGWPDEDEERFLKLKKTGDAYSLAFLNYTSGVSSQAPAYHSLMAVPIELKGEFAGGIIAYDRRPSTALEDATFTDLDRALVEQLISIAVSVIQSMAVSDFSETGVDKPAYEEILRGNMQRVKKVIDTEMARADRYHHSFSLLVFKVKPLDGMFADDGEAALRLVNEVTKGIQTRTRKTDFGAWIRQDTFALLSLEGSKRVKFLISRLMLYLIKDFSTVSGSEIPRADILIGQSAYPGMARTPEALLGEAEQNAAAQSEE